MLLSFGVLIMDMFPSQKGVKLTEVKSFIPTPGGAAANVAVAAKRLGVTSAFMGKVGDEQFGRHLARVLDSEGVDTTGMVFDPYIRTTMNFHAIRPDGTVEYLFYRNPGADNSIKPGELDMSFLSSAEIFHFDSLSLTNEPCKSAVDTAVRYLKDRGAVISFDVNYRPVLWPGVEAACERVREYAKSADIVKLNEQELALFTGMGLEDGAKRILNLGAKIVLVTLGEKGAYFAHKDISGVVAGYTVGMVDTIGCGDAFIAGFLSALLRAGRIGLDYSKEEIIEYCRFANAVAALTSTKHGCIPAMPRLEEVKKLMNEGQQ